MQTLMLVWAACIKARRRLVVLLQLDSSYVHSSNAAMLYIFKAAFQLDIELSKQQYNHKSMSFESWSAMSP